MVRLNDRDVVRQAQLRFGDDDGVRQAFWLKDLVYALRSLRDKRPDLSAEVDEFMAYYEIADIYPKE